MKWPFAVILATGALVGCRSAQPAANPFIRTTVPPPGTGQGAVVVQGEQYYPNGTPPIVGPSPPVTTAPPIVAPPPPGMAPPPTGPPPVVIPPKDKYGPPGGSYQYNQSSNDGKTLPLESMMAGDEVQLASATEPAPRAGARPAESPPEESPADRAERWLAEERPAEKSDAVKQAVMLAIDHDPLVGDEDHGREGHRPPPPLTSDARVEPPESLAADEDEPRVSTDAMRILRGQTEGSEPVELAAVEAEPAPPAAVSEPADAPVKPIAQPLSRQFAQAAEEPPAPQDGSEPASQAANDQIADSKAGEVSASDDSTDSAVASNSPAASKSPVASAAPEPGLPAASRPASAVSVEQGDYAYARDYGSLRGRLEYSQGSRQWKLRYIPIDGNTDAFGGSVVLPTSPAVESFKPGDLVAVRGSVTGKTSSTTGFSPRYELDAIEPITR